MDGWHAEAVADTFKSFNEQDESTLILDMTQASFFDARSFSTVVRALRQNSKELHIVLIANQSIADTLRQADLEPQVTIYSSIDQAAESAYFKTKSEAPRSLKQMTKGEDLPKAA